MTEEDVVSGKINHLIKHRVSWLFIGLLGGIFTTFIVFKYEAILSTDLRLAFFIPVIVYLSGALGIQTETIYVREIFERKKINLIKYLFKECIVGFSSGIISGLILGCFSFFWFKSYHLSLTIGLTMLINLSIAPLLAILVPNILYRNHIDPALGSGPVATIIQDLISLFVYFLVASFIIFS